MGISEFFVSYGIYEFFKSLCRVEVLFVILVVCFAFYLWYKFGRKRKLFTRHRNNNSVLSFFAEYGKLSEKSIEQNILDGESSSLDEEAAGEGEKPKKKKEDIWKTEERCRKIVEKIFRKPFKSERPEFLKNPVTGKNLELDMYNPELRLALEMDGRQHAEYIPHFHRGGIKQFEYQMKKDDYKTKKCKLEGIDLIRIPHHISPDHLEKYIVREVRKIERFKSYPLNTNE